MQHFTDILVMVDETPKGEAMRQLKEKGYADKHRHSGQPIHLIGVEFSRQDHKIAAFHVEPAA